MRAVVQARAGLKGMWGFMAICAGLPMLCLPLGAALAQVPDDGAAASLPAINVTSTRQDVSPFEAAASVDVVDGEALRASRPQVDLSEGLGAVPGLVLQNRRNYAQDLQLSIRGFGARSTFGIRGVRLYVDGIPATMPDGQGQSSNIDIGSIERVEVLRGPFSALYGNSSGGVVQVFTERGEGPPRIEAGFATGSDGLRRHSIKGSGSTPEGVDWLLSASRMETDGVRPQAAATRSTGNGRLGIQLSPDDRLTLVFNGVRLRAQDPLGLSREQFEADPWQATPQALAFDTRKTVDQRQAGLTWERRVDARNDLRLMLYHGQRRTTQFQAIPIAAQRSPTHAGGVIDLDRSYGGMDLRWTTRTELAGRPLDLLGGLAVDLLDEQRRGYENEADGVLGVQGRLRRDERNRVRNADPYAQARWQFAPAWSLEAGLRHSALRFRSRDHYVTAGNGDDSGAARYRRALPVAALRWQASPHLSLYATAGRGFETPTLNELSYRADGQSGLNLGLRPATSTSLEVGAKQRLAGGLLTLALFHTGTQDEIVTASNVGGRTAFQNAGRTRRQGLELGWQGRFARHGRAQLAATWLQATYRDGFCASTCTAAGQARPGNRIPGIARQVVQAELAWMPPEGWRAGVELRHVGRIAVNDGNTEFAPRYTTAAAHLGYVWRPSARWQIGAFARVDNLTNRRYAGSVIVNEGNGRYYESASGRSWSAGLQASLGF
jgi:iron complex outermembrane receptor protein